MSKNQKHFISSDENANPTLKNELGSLRGGMLGQAEKHPMPDNFTVAPHPDKACMIITNTLNGNSTEVPLYAYGNVRQALNDLF